MRIALIHDYLSQDGGAERVLKIFSELWPEAPIFVLFHDKKKINYIDKKRTRESFLAKMPFVKNIFPYYLPLMPWATTTHQLKNFDLILSSTSAFAKGVKTGSNTLNITYCHTPPRYLWSFTENYLDGLKKNRLTTKIILPKIIKHLQNWDKRSVKNIDHFIVNSETTRQRVQKYYDRDSTIIYPAINIHDFYISPKIKDYFTAGGRLAPYKKIDLVVKTFNRNGLPLKIFGVDYGVGSEIKYLKKIAKPNIEFLGKITETEKSKLLSECLAFIHPQLEDFGITPLEAMASGRPVIAYRQGGATETVVEGKTGIFFDKQTWESLYQAVKNFNTANWHSPTIREHSQNFHIKNFKKQIKKFVEDKYSLFKEKKYYEHNH
jgi:glycosyltransferase involved in cell wall biosynthesis